MLNWNQVLRYVKGRVALPSSYIEATDEEIVDWIKLITLKDFSNYVPDMERISIEPTNPNHKHEYKKSHYYIKDEENLEIIGIRECYFSIANHVGFGHPIMGTLSFDQMPAFALQTFRHKFFHPFSILDYTFKFDPPNIVQVLPDPQQFFVVEYERVQPEDLRKIPTTFHRLFMDLALADVKLWIGEKRSMYGDGRLQTPFGEIPLNGDVFKQEGQQLRDIVIERLQEETLPPIQIEIN